MKIICPTYLFQVLLSIYQIEVIRNKDTRGQTVCAGELAVRRPVIVGQG